ADVAHRPVGRGDLDTVDRAVLPAPQAPGRRDLALEAEGDEGGREELVHPLDPEAAPVSAGTVRIWAEPVPEDPDGRQPRLHHLDRIVPRGRAREDDHAGLAIVGRPRPGPARVEIALDEEAAGLGVGAE